MRYSLLIIALLTGGLLKSTGAAAQEKRVYTTSGVSLAIPLGDLRAATQNGWGTSFAGEYRLSKRVFVHGVWDNNKLPVQSAKLLAGLDPALRTTVTNLKGTYVSNTLGLFGQYRLTPGKAVQPYLTAGLGFNIITVPAPVYNDQTRLLSLESSSVLTLFGAAGAGIHWQLSKSVGVFGEGIVYYTPAKSAVTTGNNSYLTTKFGVRFPLF